MDFSDFKFENLKIRINNFLVSGISWEKIENLEIPNRPHSLESPEVFLDTVLYEEYRMDTVDGEPFSLDNWKELVNFVKSETKQEDLIMLSGDQVNDAEIPTNQTSQWKAYEDSLRVKGFSGSSISEIRNSAYHVLQKLDKDTLNKSSIKGLVVGEVQSGKTANMAGLISMAADYGFNYFIIFSGIIENLRKQTADRMYEDLSNVSRKYTWLKKDNPSIRKAQDDSDYRWENIPLNNTNNKYFTVCLKQKNRIEQLIAWLYSDSNKLKDLKVLIIDDEADQASINTSDPQYGRTAINGSLLRLVDGFEGKKLRSSNYISYTATPYANVLSEAGEKTLYPKDFILSLKPSEDYIGVKKIFGLMDPEESPQIDIQRTIPDLDVKTIHEIHKGDSSIIPTSLERAIDWFLVSSCALRAVNFKEPVSMLIHTSHQKIYHKEINDAIQRYLVSLHSEHEGNILKRLEDLYIEESGEFTKEAFLDGMPGYSIPPQEVRDYPDWSKVKVQLQNVLRLERLFSYTELDSDERPVYHKGLHIAVDNSATDIPRGDNEVVRLHYPNKGDKTPAAPMFLIIGGNTLARGLTLKGLTTSYFCRQTNLGDTLMQMGRWFGYRKGYEIYPRIWLNSLSSERFEFLAQLNEELQAEIVQMRKNKQSPKEWAVRIKNSPKLTFLNITSSSKSRGAVARELDYTGEKPQTTVFPNDVDVLKQNISHTVFFLNGLTDLDLSREGRMIWRDVKFAVVRDYLKKMIFHERSRLFDVVPLLDWYEQTLGDSDFKDWSIVLSTAHKVDVFEKVKDSRWNIQGYAPQTVMRSRRNAITDREADIGVLRTLTDEVVDIPNITEKELKDLKSENVANLRKKYDYDRVPQLVIYRIDKQNISQDEFDEKHQKRNGKRHPLSLEEDAIGIFIKIPGVRQSTSLAKTISIDLEGKYVDDDYAEEE